MVAHAVHCPSLEGAVHISRDDGSAPRSCAVRQPRVGLPQTPIFSFKRHGFLYACGMSLIRPLWLKSPTSLELTLSWQSVLQKVQILEKRGPGRDENFHFHLEKTSQIGSAFPSEKLTYLKLTDTWNVPFRRNFIP